MNEWLLFYEDGDDELRKDEAILFLILHVDNIDMGDASSNKA